MTPNSDERDACTPASSGAGWGTLRLISLQLQPAGPRISSVDVGVTPFLFQRSDLSPAYDHDHRAVTNCKHLALIERGTVEFFRVHKQHGEGWDEDKCETLRQWTSGQLTVLAGFAELKLRHGSEHALAIAEEGGSIAAPVK